MKATDPRYILAASYRRLAKTLRIRAVNYNQASKRLRSFKDAAAQLRLRAIAARELAHEFDNEARTLRAK